MSRYYNYRRSFINDQLRENLFLNEPILAERPTLCWDDNAFEASKPTAGREAEEEWERDDGAENDNDDE